MLWHGIILSLTCLYLVYNIFIGRYYSQTLTYWEHITVLKNYSVKVKLIKMTGGESKCWGSSIVLCPLGLSEMTSLGLGVIIGTLAQLLEIAIFQNAFRK